MEPSLGIRVSSQDAEKARKLLKEQDVLLKSKKVMHRDGVVFPVKHLNLDLGGVSFEVVEEDFKGLRPRDPFETFLEKKGISISSYDVIGDIAVLEIPEDIEPYERELAQALLKSKRHVKAVFKKSSAVEGEERVRGYGWLAGENRTETVHREHGCLFSMDISKVFFSPRLSFERQRIKDQVKDGEVIVDMFAGVGPYSIVIAKNRDVKVTGYDINRHAIRYFRENIRLNKVAHKVKAVEGDVREKAASGVADRVIMNLPKKGRDFLDNALEILKPKGGIVHYYGIAPRNEPYGEEIRFIMERTQAAGRKAEIVGKRIVRSYSPGEVHVAIDVKVRL